MKLKTVIQQVNPKHIRIVNEFDIEEFDEFLKLQIPFKCENATKPEHTNKKQSVKEKKEFF